METQIRLETIKKTCDVFNEFLERYNRNENPSISKIMELRGLGNRTPSSAVQLKYLNRQKNGRLTPNYKKFEPKMGRNVIVLNNEYEQNRKARRKEKQIQSEHPQIVIHSAKEITMIMEKHTTIVKLMGITIYKKEIITEKSNN